jgi:hypothetical protein
MRNPKNSWHLSDSKFGICHIDSYDDIVSDCVSAYWDEYGLSTGDDDKDYPAFDAMCDSVDKNILLYHNHDYVEYAAIGPKDMKLAQLLIKAGPEHRKFLRQIFVTVDITAPLYWWKEFDTYKVGTVANSTSTMHKVASKPITMESFEIDDYCPDILTSTEEIDYLIQFLEGLRVKYLDLVEAAKNKTLSKEVKDELNEKAKKVWKELIRWIPESWLQTRTVTMNYENLLAMCSKSQRRYHKLNEWSGVDDATLENFIKMARELPYASQFIFIDEQMS